MAGKQLQTCDNKKETLMRIRVREFPYPKENMETINIIFVLGALSIKVLQA